MIIVAELAFNDGGHVPFNSGLLAVVRKAFPFERLRFYGGVQHINEIKKQADELLVESMEWEAVNILPHNASYFSRLVGELKIFRNVLRILEKETQGFLLLTSAKPATLMALKVARLLWSKKLRAQVVLHGQLNSIIGKRSRNPVSRFQEMRTAIALSGNNNLQFLVLEKNLRDVIVREIPDLSVNVEVLEHPMPPKETEGKTQPLIYPIRFGFLGLANKTKGFPVFLELAEQVFPHYQGKVEFHAIGRLPSEESLLITNALATIPKRERLSRLDYTLGVEQLHFVVFPHLAEFYELNSSGTLLDALAWGKPLIARKIAIFENFFAKHGDIGFLFKDEKELKELVEHILEKEDPEHYIAQVDNLQKARWARSPEALAVQYLNLCKRIESQVY